MTDELTERIIADLLKEVARAEKKYGPFHSPHEGLAIIGEEFTELKRVVWQKRPDQWELRKEALHVGCTVIRFLQRLALARNSLYYRRLRKRALSLAGKTLMFLGGLCYRERNNAPCPTCNADDFSSKTWGHVAEAVLEERAELWQRLADHDRGQPLSPKGDGHR